MCQQTFSRRCNSRVALNTNIQQVFFIFFTCLAQQDMLLYVLEPLHPMEPLVSIWGTVLTTPIEKVHMQR